MNIFRWVAGGTLLGLSAAVIVLNWVLIVLTAVRKKHISGVPLAGGLAGVLGLLMIPVAGSLRYWWIPVLIDYGFAFSIVGAMYTFVRNNKNTDSI